MSNPTDAFKGCRKRDIQTLKAVFGHEVNRSPAQGGERRNKHGNVPVLPRSPPKNLFASFFNSCQYHWMILSSSKQPGRRRSSSNIHKPASSKAQWLQPIDGSPYNFASWLEARLKSRKTQWRPRPKTALHSKPSMESSGIKCARGSQSCLRFDGFVQYYHQTTNGIQNQMPPLIWSS